MNENVLIIDDEFSVREVITEQLAYHNITSKSAEDWDSAHSIVENDPVNLIICDIFLPGKSGLEILQNVKSNHPDIPVILISGYADISHAIKALELGAEDFVTKPFDLDHLTKKVQTAIQKQKNKEEYDRKINELKEQKASLEEEISQLTGDLQRSRESLKNAEQPCSTACTKHGVAPD